MKRRTPIKRKTLGERIDGAIFALAPGWGSRRMAAREIWKATEEHAKRFARIEAAEHKEIRNSRWMTSRLSETSQLELSLDDTRRRSRDIYQNDALGGVIDGKVNHVIGTGFTPQARIRATDGLITDSQASTYNDEIESVYDRWNMHADRSGRRSVWMLSRLAERVNEFDGESFTVLSDVGRASQPIPLALQVLDTERVNTPPQFEGSREVRLGIRHAENDEILGYYVENSHPFDTLEVDQGYTFIPASRMLHVFEPWFAEQTRGLPWMTRALNRARDAKDADEAAILGFQIEQCYAGFIKPAMSTGAVSARGAANGSTAAGRQLEDVVPGTIRHLDPGEEIEFGSPQRPGNTFTPFMEWNYRRVAAAINWPYEMVVKNWTGLSFAAGRLVLTDAKKATEVGQQMMRELWFSRVWERVVEESVIVGETSISPSDYVVDTHPFNRHVWIAPAWEYALKPSEDVDADLTEIDGNLATLEGKLGKRGHDLQDYIARRVREKEMLAAAGLTPAPQETPPPLAEPDDDDDEPEEPDETVETEEEEEVAS